MHLGCFSFFEYCHLTDLIKNSRPNVIDIGSYDINGSLKSLFSESYYTGIDLSEGPNVDFVVSGEKFSSDISYDIAVSCECFEHNPQYLETFLNMIQLTKANGLVAFTCATTGRPEHGTKNTSPHSSIASQKVSSNYYKNLVKEDFTKLNLDKFFSSYSFYSNMFTNDLYFIGRRSGNENNDMLPSVNKIDGIPKILELSKKLDFIKNSISKSSHEEIPRLIDDIYKNYSLSSLLLTKLMDYSIQIGYYQQALTFGDLASKYPFNQVSNLTLQALCHYKKGNLLHANELMLKVTNLPQIMTPKNATFMADIENKLFCTEKALTTIKKSLDNFPNEKDSLWRLYVWSHKIGKKDEAEKALSRMRKLYPADKRLESGEL